jgi:hypothetical protein
VLFAGLVDRVRCDVCDCDDRLEVVVYVSKGSASAQSIAEA